MSLCPPPSPPPPTLIPLLAARQTTIWATPLPNASTTPTCNAPTATSAAQSCFATQGCQAVFDKILQCFATWTPLDAPALYGEPKFELTHCCLCQDFLFTINHPWDWCKTCMLENLGRLGVAERLLGPVSGVDDAQNAFCGTPAATNLRTFLSEWNSVATAFSTFAYISSVPFVTSTCEAHEQAWLSYYTTASGNIWTAEPTSTTTGTGSVSLMSSATMTASMTGTGTAPSSTVGLNHPPPALLSLSTGAQASQSVNGWTGKSGAAGMRSGAGLREMAMLMGIVWVCWVLWGS